MLFKNGERQHLNKNEIDKLVSQFHNKFPVRVVYPPDRIVPSLSRNNIMPDMPNSISFDLRSIVKTDEGTEEWRYAESTIIDADGRVKYIPKKFIFNGSRLLGREDIELIYFLFTKSPYCLGGKNQGKNVKFMFEDLVSEAEKKAEKKAISSKIDVLLFNKDIGLSIDNIRTLAKAMFISGVDDMADAQVRVMLDKKIGDSEENMERFLELVNADIEIKARSNIQKVIDSGKIRLDSRKAVWYWQTDTPGRPVQICRITAGTNAYDALVELYMNDKNFQKDIDTLTLAKKSKELVKEPE